MAYDIGKDLGRAYADGYKQGVKDFAKMLIDKSKKQCCCNQRPARFS